MKNLLKTLDKNNNFNHLIVGTTASAKMDYQQKRKVINYFSLKSVLFQDILYTNENEKINTEAPYEIFNKVLTQLDFNGTYTFFLHQKQFFILEVVTTIEVPIKCYQVHFNDRKGSIEPTLKLIWEEGNK
ncbi:hypothetical protein ABC382_00530 [Lysinibacillus sp. 1P01SD]|uniref:hypothetical protein n=1 Tax=Lysinibacillus sp. 1P01SD TaxID=3132285 RepID=UPI0039A1C788